MPKATPPLRLEYIDPRTLDGNPLNWKKHTQRQNQALDATLDANGWAGALLYNERTKRLIDGHGRKALAIKRGDKVVPVLIGSWSDEQERQLLATLDPIGQMAQTNATALSSLLAGNQKSLSQFKGKSKEALTRLNKDITKYARDVETGEAPSVLLERRRPTTTKSSPEEDIPAPHEEGDSVYETNLKEDVIFESSLPFDIPPLRDDVLCSVIPDRVWDRTDDSLSDTSWFCYSVGPSSLPPPEKRGGGILGFFTEDYRFEMAWNDTPTFTERLQALDFAGVCLPDFSQWSNWPAAVRLHNLYRSRWCGRYWQEAGIPVVPILQAMGDIDTYADVVFGTLPIHAPVVAIQCRTSNEAGYYEDFGSLLDTAIGYLKPAHIVIYGGLDNEKYLHGHLPRRKGTKITMLHSYLYTRRHKGKKR